MKNNKSFRVVGIVVVCLLLVGAGIFMYVRNIASVMQNEDVEVTNSQIQERDDFTDTQKEMAQKGVDELEVITIGRSKQSLTDLSVSATLTASESVIENVMSRGLPNLAESYYSTEAFPSDTYGNSTIDNLCTSYVFKSMLDDLSKYAKERPVCTISTLLPAQTYTVLIASVKQKGFYYCTDRSTKGLLIELTSGYEAGKKCK
jgi:hypothetical protein